MIIQVNGKDLEFDNQLSVTDLINQLGYQDQRIAIEVNESIIPKSKHTEFILNNSDQVEIIKAVGGG